MPEAQARIVAKQQARVHKRCHQKKPEDAALLLRLLACACYLVVIPAQAGIQACGGLSGSAKLVERPTSL